MVKVVVHDAIELPAVARKSAKYFSHGKMTGRYQKNVVTRASGKIADVLAILLFLKFTSVDLTKSHGLQRCQRRHGNLIAIEFIRAIFLYPDQYQLISIMTANADDLVP